MNAVRDEPDVGTLEKARTAGYLASIALKAVEIADLNAGGSLGAGSDAQEGGMKDNNLGGIYDQLTPDECFHLLPEAAARQDETEVERLAGTCQRHHHTSIRTDPHSRSVSGRAGRSRSP